MPFCCAHNKEAHGIEHFVGQRISEVFYASAYHADRMLIDGYGRLRGAEGPTNIFPNRLEKRLSKLGRDPLFRANHSALLPAGACGTKSTMVNNVPVWTCPAESYRLTAT